MYSSLKILRRKGRTALERARSVLQPRPSRPGPDRVYDVAILGWWYGQNYGSVLTYYSLRHTIMQLGYDVLMVHEPLGYNAYRVRWPNDIMAMRFAKRHGYDHTEQVHFEHLPDLNARARTFVVGSDQLWNPLVGRVNNDLFLDFVSHRRKRIAYATSFGNRTIEKFKPEFVTVHSDNLQKFDAISVRESFAVDVAKTVFGATAVQTVDPVFLVNPAHFASLAERSTLQCPENYLAVFLLDANAQKKRVIDAVAKKLGYSDIVIIPNPDKGRALAEDLFGGGGYHIIDQQDPEDFLKAYHGAGYVVSDSFHGTAFATIFNKPFSSFYNQKRGVDRFKELMEIFGLGDSRRILERHTTEDIEANDNVSHDLDYETANARMAKQAARSLDWLKEQLAAEPAHAPSPAPVFETDSDVWKITNSPQVARLSVTPVKAAKGHRVWCPLPKPIEAGKAYRLIVEGRFRTTSTALTAHLIDVQSKAFRGIGKIAPGGKTGEAKVDFIAPAGAFRHLMFGAVHFTGKTAGAEITALSLQEISVETVKAQQQSSALEDRAKDLALADHDRFTGALTRARRTGHIGLHRARLMFHAHAIEKGLSRQDFRPGFGKIAVPGLARELNSWIEKGHSLQDEYARISAGVMKAYFERHQALKADVSAFRALFSPEALALIAGGDMRIGGVSPAADPRAIDPADFADRSFGEVLFGRRSVRDFTNLPVADESLRRAVQVAMQAPSVCNRQGPRVHQFEDPSVIKKAVGLQGGFGGYTPPPRLLLVTADLTAYLFAEERHQAFVDGGLFMMNLLLGLEHEGLGACSLNTAMGTKKEAALRALLQIPPDEVFISFVAVGHFDRQVLVPRSSRAPVEAILIPHKA